MRKTSVIALLAAILWLALSCSGKETEPQKTASPKQVTDRTATPVTSADPSPLASDPSLVDPPAELSSRDEGASHEVVVEGEEEKANQTDTDDGTADAAPPTESKDTTTAKDPSADAASAPAKSVYSLGRVGYIANYRGEVSVRRGDEVFSGDDIDFGFELYPYDLMSTGPKSYAEVDLNASYPGGSYIRLSERTNFWFDLGTVADDGSMETDIRLLAGAIALKVEKLSSRGRVQVSSESAAFGVRGTEFIVTLGPEASALVTCLEGRVACTDETGTVFDAIPGQAVEKRFDAPVQTVPKDLEELGPWRAAWLGERTDEFYRDPARYVSPYAAQARKWGPGFDTAALALEKHRTIWDRWAAAVAAGKTYSFVELGNDKKKVNNDLFAAARELFFYEAAHYRLVDMINRLSRPVEGYNVQALPSELAAIKKELDRREARLARVREIFMLYGTVSDGSPLGEFFMERSESSVWDM